MSERVKVGFRVDSAVLGAFVDTVEQKYGKAHPYASITLENELRAVIDEGDISALRDAVLDLEGSLPAESERKINSEVMPASGTRRKCQLRVSSTVKSAIKELVRSHGASARSSGRFVESVMWGYVTDGSMVEQLTRRVEACSDAVETLRDVESLGAKERRTRVAAEQLSDIAFTIDDFDASFEQVRGIGAGPTAREVYLHRVLEYKSMTWHPDNQSLFINPDEYDVPTTRDPRRMPKVLRDEEDEKLAVMCEAYDDAVASRLAGVVDRFEAVELLGGVSHQRVGSLMRDICESHAGFEYNQHREALKCDADAVLHHDVLTVCAGESQSRERDGETAEVAP